MNLTKRQKELLIRLVDLNRSHNAPTFYLRKYLGLSLSDKEGEIILPLSLYDEKEYEQLGKLHLLNAHEERAVMHIKILQKGIDYATYFSKGGRLKELRQNQREFLMELYRYDEIYQPVRFGLEGRDTITIFTNYSPECIKMPAPKPIDGADLDIMRSSGYLYAQLGNGQWTIKLMQKAIDAINDVPEDQNFQESTPMPIIATPLHPVVPMIIVDSYQRFKDQYGDQKTCFIMMKFERTPLQNNAATAIKESLKFHGVIGMVADEKNYHKSLHYNIMTYMHACTYGLAMFDRAVTENFNPNVSYEVGYMMALDKHVCLLKDKSIQGLQTDLGGLTYKQFDIQSPQDTIKAAIDQWFYDIDHSTQAPSATLVATPAVVNKPQAHGTGLMLEDEVMIDPNIPGIAYCAKCFYDKNAKSVMTEQPHDAKRVTGKHFECKNCGHLAKPYEYKFTGF